MSRAKAVCAGASALLLALGPLSYPQAETPDVRPSPQVATEGSGVQRVHRVYDDDPFVTLRSYAAADIGGCSATMIGPNTLLTAAHCGTARRNAAFRVYRSLTDVVTETFDCQYMLQTFYDTDLNLYHCAANAAGQDPGDKYGYLDFDIDISPTGRFLYEASRGRLAMGRELYSIWSNPITSLGISGAMLYSDGRLTDPTSRNWFNPNLTDYCIVDQGSDAQPLGVSSDLWSNGGASGSSQISKGNQKVLLAPLSTGAGDGRGRNSASIADNLYWGFIYNPFGASPCAAGHGNQINRTHLESLGLDPTAFATWVDDNLDGIFDVQNALEKRTGERRRGWYWLGFESNRRNSLWTKTGRVEIYPELLLIGVDPDLAVSGSGARLTTLGAPDTSLRSVLEHRRLNLRPSTPYAVSFLIAVSSSDTTGPRVRVRLGNAYQDFTPTLGRWEYHVARLNPGAGANPALVFEVAGRSAVTLSQVSVVQEGVHMDFDTADQRFLWKSHNPPNRRSYIWPNGNGTGANWAGLVRRDPSRGTFKDDWSLASTQLGLAGGEARVCFDHRRSDREPLVNGSGTMRVMGPSGELSASYTTFSPTSSWQRRCSAWFPTPTDRNTLMFGTNASSAAASGSYLVDRIAIQRR